MPDSCYFGIPGAGHNANQDNPSAFDRALLDFLADTVDESLALAR